MTLAGGGAMILRVFGAGLNAATDQCRFAAVAIYEAP
jgi:hypothetical protein